MILHKSNYLQIELIGEGYAFYTWLPATEYMTEDEYHQENRMILKYTQENNILRHLLDARKFKFSIAPDIQEEVAQQFFAEIIKLGKQKVAFLVPEEIFSMVSLRQVMEEEQTGTLQTQYFDSLKEAQKWLRNHN